MKDFSISMALKNKKKSTTGHVKGNYNDIIVGLSYLVVKTGKVSKKETLEVLEDLNMLVRNAHKEFEKMAEADLCKKKN